MAAIGMADDHRGGVRVPPPHDDRRFSIVGMPRLGDDHDALDRDVYRGIPRLKSCFSCDYLQ
jgi:hypothetical protein